LFAAGACSSKVPPEVAELFWQYGDHKGQNSKLLLPGAAYERAHGLDDDECEGSSSECDGVEDRHRDPGAEGASFVISRLPSSSVCTLFGSYPAAPQHWDALELYAGTHGISTALHHEGFACLPLELLHGVGLLSPEWFEWVVRGVGSQQFPFIWMAPPCTTFSVARRPALRSKSCALGFDESDPKVAVGNQHALQSLLIARVARAAGARFVIENPGSGYMRHLPEWLALLAEADVEEVYCNMCQFGAPFAKLTVLLTNCSALAAMNKRCTCPGTHEQRLQGSATKLA
jgi:hypothetical protein